MRYWQRRNETMIFVRVVLIIAVSMAAVIGVAWESGFITAAAYLWFMLMLMNVDVKHMERMRKLAATVQSILNNPR